MPLADRVVEGARAVHAPEARAPWPASDTVTGVRGGQPVPCTRNTVFAVA